MLIAVSIYGGSFMHDYLEARELDSGAASGLDTTTQARIVQWVSV